SGLTMQHHFVVKFRDGNIAMPDAALQIGDPDTVTPNDPFSGHGGAGAANLINGSSGNDLIYGRHGSDTPGQENVLNGAGGRDTIIGGDNLINGDRIIVGDANFHYVDGGAGNDTLVLGGSTLPAGLFDFTTMPSDLSGIVTPDGTHVTGIVRNIET